MGIIEKLGIEPINWFKYEGYLDKLCYQTEVKELEQQRNEMLEALINNNLALELIQNKKTPGKIYLANKKLIEKIAKMPWSEIKELYYEK